MIDNDNNNKFKIAVLGGDKRQTVLINRLIENGFSVRYYGIGEYGNSCVGAELCSSADKATEGTDAVILPLPVTRDNLYLASQGEKLPLCDIMKLIAKNNALLLGGMIPPEMLHRCSSLGIEAFDYYKCESLQRKNALPSAEGALMIAMEHTEVTIKGMKALVCGYGRIGSLLANMLDKLGASVTVGARRDEALCEISLNGFNTVRLGGDLCNLANAASKCDVIFNTVPAIIFNASVLKKVRNKPIYIEIASSPGGIDLAAARDAGIETVFAPSLPGKYAPLSAGEYIFETVFEYLSERRKI